MVDNHINPIALRKAETVCNFGLSECNRVKAENQNGNFSFITFITYDILKLRISPLCPLYQCANFHFIPLSICRNILQTIVMDGWPAGWTDKVATICSLFWKHNIVFIWLLDRFFPSIEWQQITKSVLRNFATIQVLPFLNNPKDLDPSYLIRWI